MMGLREERTMPRCCPSRRTTAGSRTAGLALTPSGTAASVAAASLGYEPYDARLCRLGRSPLATLTLVISPVSVRPAASLAQIRARIGSV